MRLEVRKGMINEVLVHKPSNLKAVFSEHDYAGLGSFLA